MNTCQEKRISALQKLRAFELEYPDSGFHLCSETRMKAGAKPGSKFNLRMGFCLLVEVMDARFARYHEVGRHATNDVADWGLEPCLQRQ